MSDTLAVPCPECDNTLKVPPQVLGKKIKCKHCGHAFVAQDPAAKARPAKAAAGKAAAKPAAAPKPEPPPEPKPKSPFLEDDEDDDKNPKPMGVLAEDEVPRCPHCAIELDPPDAVVCTNCGFNNRTRVKAETKKVWQPTAGDWAAHLAPGIIALLLLIGAVVLDIVCLMNMRDWLGGTFLEMDDEKDSQGRKKFFVPPGAFSVWIMVMSLAIIVPCGKFAYRRLVKNYRPEEQVKK